MSCANAWRCQLVPGASRRRFEPCVRFSRTRPVLAGVPSRRAVASTATLVETCSGAGSGNSRHPAHELFRLPPEHK
jgi:hypothetical protein